MKEKLFTLFLVVLLLITGCSKDTTKTDKKQESNGSQVKIVKVMIKKENSQNFYVVTTANGNDLKYAYYVLKDNKVIKKQLYIQDSYFTYKITEPGDYKVQAFVMDGNGKKVAKYTQTIKMEM
ncbi:hypothetical protein CN481_24635 [Bacillus sp. AFS006103]|nr:hypothetical protein CN481_24635 [Bacillus sp. AFS006103]